MSTTPSHKELFRAANTKDKLTLFQILLDGKLLTEDMSLALLKVIHKELGIYNGRIDRALYKSYAASISALNYHTADILRHVENAWKRNGNGRK